MHQQSKIWKKLKICAFEKLKKWQQINILYLHRPKGSRWAGASRLGWTTCVCLTFGVAYKRLATDSSPPLAAGIFPSSRESPPPFLTGCTPSRARELFHPYHFIHTHWICMWGEKFRTKNHSLLFLHRFWVLTVGFLSDRRSRVRYLQDFCIDIPGKAGQRGRGDTHTTRSWFRV